MRRKDSTNRNGCVTEQTRWKQNKSRRPTYYVETHCSQSLDEEAASCLLLPSTCGALATPDSLAPSILPQSALPLKTRHDLKLSLTGHLHCVALDVTASSKLMFESPKDHVVSHGRKLLFPTHTAFNQRHRAGLLMFEFRRTSRPVKRLSRAASGPKRP